MDVRLVLSDCDIFWFCTVFPWRGMFLFRFGHLISVNSIVVLISFILPVKHFTPK